MTDINIKGKKRFLSFLYKAGDKKRINWINKKGTENKNDANKAIFILETNTSGKAVKIILLFWEPSKANIKGFVNISLTKLTLKKKKEKATIRNTKLSNILFLSSFKYCKYFINIIIFLIFF